MSDVFTTISEATIDMQEHLSDILELRARDPRHRQMLETYLSYLEMPADALVLEVGCGTGPVSRYLADQPTVRHVYGIDPSPVFIQNAKGISSSIQNLTFEEGDGRALRFTDATFDVAVLHTCLCHLSKPDDVLIEVARVLKPRGLLAVFDGDYAGTTVAADDFDPVQCCIGAARAAFVHDQWLTRHLRALIQSSGFEVLRYDAHAYTQTDSPEYAFTLVDRGADRLVSNGCIGMALGSALKEEARRRVEMGDFYASTTFISVVGRRLSTN